jgi:hypothetical protein
LRELAGGNGWIPRKGREGRKGKGAKPEIAIRQNHLYGKSNETKLN